MRVTAQTEAAYFPPSSLERRLCLIHYQSLVLRSGPPPRVVKPSVWRRCVTAASSGTSERRPAAQTVRVLTEESGVAALPPQGCRSSGSWRPDPAPVSDSQGERSTCGHLLSVGGLGKELSEVRRMERISARTKCGSTRRAP